MKSNMDKFDKKIRNRDLTEILGAIGAIPFLLISVMSFHSLRVRLRQLLEFPGGFMSFIA